MKRFIYLALFFGISNANAQENISYQKPSSEILDLVDVKAAPSVLIDESKFKFCWIVDFPLFDYNDEEQCWEPAHHMFSMPQDRFIDTMEETPGEVLGDLYDLVLNGYEACWYKDLIVHRNLLLEAHLHVIHAK